MARDIHTREQLIILLIEAADNVRGATRRGDDIGRDEWLANVREYSAMITIAENHGGAYVGTVWNNAGSAINAAPLEAE